MQKFLRWIPILFFLISYNSLIHGYSGQGDVLKNDVRTFIINLADHIIDLDLGSGYLSDGDVSEFVYVHGNFALTLIGAYEITGNAAYINEVLDWCDWFITQQVVYDDGDKGYWGDTGPEEGNTYLADTQNAALALACAIKYANSSQKTAYILALQRFLNRVVAGGLIMEEGFYKGALNINGDGAKEGYTISTAFGAALWSMYYHLTGNEDALRVASYNAKWLISSIESDGVFPLYYYGRNDSTTAFGHPILPSSYGSFGLITYYRLSPHQDIKAIIHSEEVAANIQWILNHQDPVTGRWLCTDAALSRSPLLGNYLNWYYHEIDSTREDVAEGLRKWYSYVLDTGWGTSNRYKCLIGVFMVDLYKRHVATMVSAEDSSYRWTESSTEDFTDGQTSGTEVSSGSIKLSSGTSGTYISSEKFMGDSVKGYDVLKWQANESVPCLTNEWYLKFQTRTCSTQAGLQNAEWYGPTSTRDYYASSGSQINAIHNNQPWIQYKAVFFSTLANAPLSLDNVSIIGKSKMLPMVFEDLTPPPNVTLNSATLDNGQIVTLSWEPAIDIESGIYAYEIFRGASEYPTTLISKIPGSVSILKDTVNRENTTVYYRIKAVNGAGLTSIDFSNPLSAVTGTDPISPTISSVIYKDSITLWVVFNEPVEATSAEAPGNYSIYGGASVNSASLRGDSVTAVLTVSSLLAFQGSACTLTVSNVRDRAGTPNTILNGSVADVEIPFLLVDFGANEGGNVLGLTGWNTVIKDIYCYYSNADSSAPSGLKQGTNGAYSYQGVTGPARDFVPNEKIMVTWYNNSDTVMTFTPRISLEDPDRRITGEEGTWFSMSKITLSPHTSGTTVFNVDIDNTGIYDVVNINPDYFPESKILICDKIELLASEQHYVSGKDNGLDNNLDLNLTVYPNPFNPIINIVVSRQNSAASENVSIRIYNVSGKLVKKFLPADYCPRTTSYTWQASGHPSGIYLIKVKINDKLIHKRITLIK